jgi:hypothetical protein
MEVEGNIPFFAGGRLEAQPDGENLPEMASEPNANKPIRPTPKPTEVEDAVRDEVAVDEVEDEIAEEFEPSPPVCAGSSSGDQIPMNVSGDQIPMGAKGDITAVYSEDCADTIEEALTMRHLATHKPKLDSCDTCRR